MNIQQLGAAICMTAATFSLAQSSLGESQSFAAGGWAGGGGEVIKNMNNPWFLENTQVVKYCVQRGAHFSLEAGRAQDLLEKAFLAWKRELVATAGTAEQIRNVRVIVGHQEFTRSSCDGTEDITFQLGVLTAEQRHYFGEYRRYVGAAIRTSYDESYLKGKGFVFLAADSGGERYEGDAPDFFWSADEGMRFYRVALHELGHVFGVPHLDVIQSHPIGMGVSIMDADAPEKIVAGEQAVWPFDVDAPSLRVLSRPFVPPTLCKDAGYEQWHLHRFFEVSNSYKCIRVEKDGERYLVKVHPDILRQPQTPFTLQGVISLDGDAKTDYQPIITVKITRNQRVYDLSDWGDAVLDLLKYLPGPGFVRTKISGKFIAGATGNIKPLAIIHEFTSDLEISGILDGRFYSNLYGTRLAA